MENILKKKRKWELTNKWTATTGGEAYQLSNIEQFTGKWIKDKRKKNGKTTILVQMFSMILKGKNKIANVLSYDGKIKPEDNT